MNEKIIQLRDAIKVIATEQIKLKQNRKTVNFKGDRIMSPSEATWKVMSNKNQLRHMYLAYGKARGKDLGLIDRNYGHCMESKRLFVLVRDDLKSEGYKAVQAGHAVAKFTIQRPDLWRNEYLIYVRVKNYDQLRLWLMKIRESNFYYRYFCEPDLNNEMTAIACLPEDPSFFDKLQVLE